MEPAKIPDGFEPLAFRSPFAAGLGRFYTARRGGKRIVATLIEPPHANSMGYVHGGFLLAFADLALSHGTYEAADTPPSITLSMTSDFLRPAKVGDWLEAEISVRKSSPSLIFADAILSVGARQILRVSGLFKPVPEDRNSPQN